MMKHKKKYGSNSFKRAAQPRLHRYDFLATSVCVLPWQLEYTLVCMYLKAGEGPGIGEDPAAAVSAQVV